MKTRTVVVRKKLRYLTHLNFILETSTDGKITLNFERIYDPVSEKYLIGCCEAEYNLMEEGTPEEKQLAAYHIWMCQDLFCTRCKKIKPLLQELVGKQKEKGNHVSKNFEQ